jgi:tRNA dimethylallyltransferase
MLYLRSLISGISVLPAGSEAVRAAIDADAAQLGWPAMHERLAGLDPVAAARIHPNDAQRIQRALEVHTIAGEPLSALQGRSAGESRLDREFVVAALVPGDRARLHSDLASRFERMMEAGLLEEVRRLHDRGDLTAGHPSLRAVGYRQLWSHLEGAYPLAAAIERGVAATRQLAKRQLTWLRAMPDIHVFDPHDCQAFVGVRECLKSAFYLL